MGQRLGSLIGAIGGMMFVLINAGALGSPLSVVLRVLEALLLLATIWCAVVRSRGATDDGPPSRSALRTYWICVAAEVVAIIAGAQVFIRVLGRPELSLVWVVFVLGVHFVPFAWAFGFTRFAVLGVVLMAVAVVGGLVTVLVTPLGSPVTGVVAGIVLLGFALGAGLVGPRVAAHPSRTG